MEEEVLVYFIGTAGSGKTTLVHAFQNWMSLNGLDTVTVNLDPGVESLPYAPDIDIREWLNLTDVMRTEGLGPNGAQIACADMLALEVQKVRKILDEFRTNYVLIDTPGQMELFSFRKSSTYIVDELGRDRSAIVFTLDPFISKTPTGYIAQLLLTATIQFRFNLPMISALTKSDLLSEEELQTISNWVDNPTALYDAAVAESPSMHVQMSLELFRAMESIGVHKSFAVTSSENNVGMEDIYNAIQQVFAGGEDLSKD